MLAPFNLFATRALVCLMLTACFAGCRAAHAIRDPDYGDLVCHLAEIDGADAWSDVQTHDVSRPAVADELAGPQPVETYIAYALGQNPRIQAARKNWEAMDQRILQAASLEDPMLDVVGFPFFPNVPQTASGRKTVDMMASQEVPWFGTLRTRAMAAEAEAEAARAELTAAELDVVRDVQRAYYELYYLQQATAATREEREELLKLVEIVKAKLTASEVPKQDYLRVKLEVDEVDSRLIALSQEHTSARARLARVLHVAPETPLEALDSLDDRTVPRDIERLYEQALAARPELQAQLAASIRDRDLVELAHLKYFPDFTLSVGWGEMTRSRALAATADGLDDVSIGLAVNLPVYRRRLDAAVREAEARAVSTAREYDAMRDETVEEVTDLLAQATSQEQLLRLFRDEVIPKAEDTLMLSITSYQVGEIDIQQLIENWRQLLRYEVAVYRLEAQLRQTLAALERVVGRLSP